MPTPEPDAPAALVYARMSMDSTGKELGLTRQIAGEDGALRLCAARGWTVREDHVYTDNDLSASTGIFRPGYADLIAAIERGEARIIVTYQLSRLWRQRRERAEGMETLKTHRVKVVTVKGPELDLSTAYGRGMVGLLGEFDTMESDVKGERMCSSILQKARAGKQSGGGHRPFGYQIRFKIVSGPGEKIRRRIDDPRRDVTLHPTEAPVVADCARRVLAGESIASIVRDLNDHGIRTSAGNPWNRTTLRRMLCSARISGRREHIPRASYGTTRPLVGEIVWEPRGDSGTPAWPAIISVADSDRLRTLMSRPERRITTGGSRKHLLSGILHCARCEQPMVGRSSRGVLRYVCNRNPDGGKDACGRMYITAAPSDEHIRDLVLTALGSPAMTERLRRRDTAPDDLHARIRAEEDTLEALAADHGAGEISRAEWKAARTPVRARLDAARQRLARSTQTNALEGFVGTLDDMRARWEAANNSQRRAVITAVLEKVVVHPAPVMGRNRFDPDRLEPIWRA
ncbi:MAG: recombinase family protein [Pseudonocardiales bacterium]|nr:recombinase family protein [Pseudonocardiales bacterium]